MSAAEHSTRFSENTVTNVEQLRSVIPNYPAVLDKRIKSRLDHHGLEFIQHARVAVLATPSCAKRPFQFIDVQSTGKFAVVNDVRLKLSDMHQALVGGTFEGSLYFLIPGINHGLRINGTLLIDDDLNSTFFIEQVYFHCGRAAMRSNLWQPEQKMNTRPDVQMLVADFLDHAAYFLIATANQHGRTQISPRGESPGSVRIINDGKTLFIPERPGNKVAISLRNILENPNVAICALIPGSSHVLSLTGKGYVCKDPALLAASTVGHHQPKLGIAVDLEYLTIRYHSELDALGLWNQEKMTDESDIMAFSKVLNEHMMGNGLKGKVSHVAIKAIIEKDKRNLY